MWIAVAAGALFGGGLVLMLRGSLWAAPPPLATLLSDLRRPRELAPLRQSHLDQIAERIAGRAATRREADLAVCERTRAMFVQQRITWALLGAAPGFAFVAFSSTGVLALVPVGWALAASAVGFVAGWFYALVDLRADAAGRRREFRHTLAAYLELVTLLMAGGAGVETALFDAADIGRGPAFRQLHAALSAAKARREPPWTTLGALGDRLEVLELRELDASMTLAGEGARVRASLTAKAEAMRTKDLSQLEAEAQTRSETLVLPVAMMFAGFLLLIGYPALAGLSATP